MNTSKNIEQNASRTIGENETIEQNKSKENKSGTAK